MKETSEIYIENLIIEVVILAFLSVISGIAVHIGNDGEEFFDIIVLIIFKTHEKSIPQAPFPHIFMPVWS